MSSEPKHPKTRQLQQQSNDSKAPPAASKHPLEEMRDRIHAALTASGLTLKEMEPPTATGTYKVNFIPRAKTN